MLSTPKAKVPQKRNSKVKSVRKESVTDDVIKTRKTPDYEVKDDAILVVKKCEVLEEGLKPNENENPILEGHSNICDVSEVDTDAAELDDTILKKEFPCGSDTVLNVSEKLGDSQMKSEGPAGKLECCPVNTENTCVDYAKLLDDVNIYMENISEPSAPIADATSKTEVAEENGNIFSSLYKVDTKTIPKLIEKSNVIEFFENCQEETISPLSDEELSKFYFNEELNQCEDCITSFIENELNTSNKIIDPFYKLLSDYLKTKNCLKASKQKMKNLKEKLDNCISQMWFVLNDVEINQTEKCKDGNPISVTHKYTQAKFDSDVFKTFKDMLMDVKCTLFEDVKINSFNCLKLKIKIEQYIKELMASCPEFTSINESSPITLMKLSSDTYFNKCLKDLKVAIGILFLFQRKQNIDTCSSFITETRKWLSEMVSVLVRTGNWEDHLYILNHILRCPGGVGDWAAKYVQFPSCTDCSNPFSDRTINHMMTVLSILLRPIDKRQDFMNEWDVLMNCSDENSWVIIDSDEEDDETSHSSSPLKENDLVLLLNQIPLKILFSSILGLSNGVLNPQIITVDHLMKLFSFCSDFIRIIHRGLLEYSTQRYKQFAKRLGRLILHIIEYVTDEYEYFKNCNQGSSDNLNRLQTEYDNFFMKSTVSIYSSRIYGTWQFLVVVPYHMTSRSVILKLFSTLQLQDPNLKQNSVNLIDFEEKFSQLPDSEQFYLLSAFTNIALARNLSEVEFIKVIVHQLFYIGFLGKLTKDKCYKYVKSLLHNLCFVYPFLMSKILLVQNDEFQCDTSCDLTLCIYLWKELPVKQWKPTQDDLQILFSWLMSSQSIYGEISKLIIKSLNFCSKLDNLFLSITTHREIAYMIMKASVVAKQHDEKNNVIKNMSSLVKLQEPEQSLQTWCWDVLLKLRLHLCDQPIKSVRMTLENLNENLKCVPDLVSDSELQQLVLQKNPIACFVALMTTTMGHSVPLIFNGGFLLLETLLNAKKPEAAIACIQYMTLLFLDCPDSLYKCQHFTSILTNLVTADYSYLKLAKNLKAFETPGPILLSLESMIQYQINSCDELGINRHTLIELWFKSLTKIPLWTQEFGIIYLLNALCKNAFFDRNTSFIIKNLLSSLVSEISISPVETKSSFASLINWMNVKSTVPTLLDRGYVSSSVWYFLNVLNLEQEIYETSTQLWNELLKELLANTDKKTNVDNCLKKACSNLKLPIRTSDALSIYKLSYQILETKFTHPLIVLLWQKFFLLYLQRVPDQINNVCVGEKFFHGIINQNIFKKLRQRLEETLNYFQDHENKSRNRPPDELEHFCKYSNIFRTFMLWLDEPKLQAPNPVLPLLSPQFNVELLRKVINGDNTPWIEFVDFNQVQDEIRICSSSWMDLTNRRNKSEKAFSPTSNHEKSCAERIQSGLLRYDNPITDNGPDVQQNIYKRTIKGIIAQPNSLGAFIRPSLNNIKDYANYYVQELGEHVGLGCDLQDLVQDLYIVKKSSVTYRETCGGTEKIINSRKIFFKCSGPAVITIPFEAAEINVKNNELFKKSLINFNRSIHNALLPLQQSLGNSVVSLEKVIEELRSEYLFMKSNCDNEKLISDLSETGITLFYELLNSWTEEATFTPAVKSVIEHCITDLGKTFIINNASQCGAILNTISRNPTFLNLLQEYFNPNAASSREFLELYSQVKTCTMEIKLILLLKFELTKWLTEKKPKFVDRSLLLTAIGSGLNSCGSYSTSHLDLVKIYNTHLQQILMHDFPEHYGEILNILLEGSNAQTIPVSTWFMFLNSLIPNGIHFIEGRSDGNTQEPVQSVQKLKFFFTQYATQQTLLSLSNIRETIIHLANKFKIDRLHHGLYGLYPKYRQYIEAIFIFFGMLSHSYIAETVKLDLGSLSVRITDHLWPHLRDLYSPWLIPYWSKQEKSQSAKWIQELTDDKCVLLPWVTSDSSFASFGCDIFINSIRFVLDTLPGINNILNHVWYFYVTNYTHNQVKDHILRIIHKSILQLPWCAFYPTLSDIELMVKIVEHFIPMAHNFLGNVFIEIKWHDVVSCYQKQDDLESLIKLQVYLFHLFVKLPCEPSLKQNNKIHILLSEAKDYAWHLVDSNTYDCVLNWFIMSCDPRIVLLDEKLEYYKLDSLILQILRNCAGFKNASNHFHPVAPTKRLMYIRANVKWLITTNIRFKCKDSALFKTAILRILDEIESFVNTFVPDCQKSEDLVLLLSEFLNLFKEEELIPILQKEIISWVSTRKSTLIICGFLRSMRLNQTNLTVFENLSEACLDSYFEKNDNSSWAEIISKIPGQAFSRSGFCKALIGNQNILTCYLILLNHIEADCSLSENKALINEILQSLTSIDKREEVESKLLLLVIYAFRLAEKVIKIDEPEGISILSRLFGFFTSTISDKKSGLFSTFGIIKSNSFSNRFKFMCLVASCGISILFQNSYEGKGAFDDNVLSTLENASTNKQFQSLYHYIVMAAGEIREVKSINELIELLKKLALQIFNKKYLM